MQITLTNADFDKAVSNYVKEMGINAPVINVEYSLSRAKKGKDGTKGVGGELTAAVTVGVGMGVSAGISGNAEVTEPVKTEPSAPKAETVSAPDSDNKSSADESETVEAKEPAIKAGTKPNPFAKTS